MTPARGQIRPAKAGSAARKTRAVPGFMRGAG